MPHVTFAVPDLTTFCRLDELGLQAVSQTRSPEHSQPAEHEAATSLKEPDQPVHEVHSEEADYLCVGHYRRGERMPILGVVRHRLDHGGEENL